MNDTPIIQQYKNIKASHNDKIIFFHLGDFYEMFYEDAVLVSNILGITLTQRKNLEEIVPMCGIPISNKDVYIKKLLREGHKIAICEQTETPDEAKKRGCKLVNRSITSIFSQSTYFEEDSAFNNYMLSITEDTYMYFCFYLDISTKDFFYEKINKNHLMDIIHRINPKEILLVENSNINIGEFEDIVTYIKGNYTSNYPKEVENFISISNNKMEEKAINILFYYIESTYNIIPTHAPKIGVNSSETMLDKITIKNLDIFTDEGLSFFSLMNRTKTPMGKRKLREMIVKPLIESKSIKKRLEVVTFFAHNIIINNSFNLNNIGDLSRYFYLLKKGKRGYNLVFKFIESIINSQKFIDYMKKKENLPLLLLELINSYKTPILCEDFFDKIENKPNIFKENISKELLKNININEAIKDMEEETKFIQKIVFCKLCNNSIIGYFFETSKNEQNKIEANGFIIKQILKNVIRFTTKKLIELENQLYCLEEQKKDLLKNHLEIYLEKIFIEEENIHKLSEIISYIDVLYGFGELALENNYKIPIIKDKFCFFYKQGRHPIIEKIKNNFIPNDLSLNNYNISIITGANMGGKSTLMRQTALITLMAQIGSFVSADFFEIRPFKKISIRIGSGDNYKQDASTFFEEMKEISNIIENADEYSLLLIDEIARGTGYKEGVSLSKGIIEYLYNKKILSIISTHYLEIAHHFYNYEKILCLKICYLYKENNLIFLHKFLEGIAESSLGIEVAKMAGIPLEIIKTAESNNN
ncbi:hypothetical protein AB836_00565 [Rickettsiales bacterium (ex Bugula neritina AB1)]|nr:hypothetical protein AB836_00565 [Rickettsiales bacterium (ex Bugula neritina AB1)]